LKLILALIISVTALTAQAEVQVPNAPHANKMFMVHKYVDNSAGVVRGMFRTTWKSGVDSYTVVSANCGDNTMRDLAYGEGSESNVKKYPDSAQKNYQIVGADYVTRYEGSMSYNRYRALCG
jgi:hypothetical protein